MAPSMGFRMTESMQILVSEFALYFLAVRFAGVRPEKIFPDLLCLTIKCLRIGVLGLILQDQSQAVDALGSGGILQPQSSFAKCEGPFE